MKVLILIDNFLNKNGAENSIIRIINNLSSEITFYLSPLEYNIDLVKTCYIKKFFPLVPYSLFSKNLIKNVFYLYKVVRKNKIDIIMSFYEGSDFIAFLLKSLLRNKIKTISNRRDLGYRLKKQHHIMYKFISSKFDYIVCVSKEVRKLNIKKYKIPSNKIGVIYNGIDIENFEKAYKKSKRFYLDTINIGTCTSFRKVKRIDLMLIAIEKLTKKHNNILFHLVGKEDEISKEEIIKLADQLNIKNKIIIWGWQNNVTNALKNFDIYLNASESEGLSNAILEAMAAYLPIIATNVGGNKEVVSHGKNGFLFPVGNLPKMIHYLENLSTNKVLRRKMGEKSRELIEEKFTQENMINNYKKLFETIL